MPNLKPPVMVTFPDEAARAEFIRDNGLTYAGNEVWPDFYEARNHPAAGGHYLYLRFFSRLVARLSICLDPDKLPTDYGARED